MKIAVGSDRRGFEVKEKLKMHLIDIGYEVIDEGSFDNIVPVDYPIYGEKVGVDVASGVSRFGVVCCATGIGIMISANKVKGIRCGIAYSDEVARLMREHNDANVIAFGQAQMEYQDIERRLDIFLSTEYLGGYHDYRIKQMSDIEKGTEISQSPIINK